MCKIIGVGVLKIITDDVLIGWTFISFSLLARIQFICSGKRHFHLNRIVLLENSIINNNQVLSFKK